MSYEPPILSYDELREQAEEFLGTYHSEGSIPTPIEEIVEFDFGMEVVPVPGLKEEIGVDAFLASSLSSVYVDEYVLQFVRVRYHFSLAHEIGHYWLHDDLYQAVNVASVNDWRQVQEAIGDQYHWSEFQANAFVGLVLVPPRSLKARFIRRVEEAKAVGLVHARLLRHPLRQRMVEGLAREFEVSEQTMAIRLEKDGLLPPLVED